MDAEGYPEESELDLIKNWDYKEVFSLLDFVQERWTYSDCFRKKWTKHRYSGSQLLQVEMITGGWSGNESLVNALLENTMIRHFCYVEWKTGGYHKFEIKPESAGYCLVSDMAEKKKMSRQGIHKNAKKYEWLTMGKRTQLIREKSKETVS